MFIHVPQTTTVGDFESVKYVTIVRKMIHFKLGNVMIPEEISFVSTDFSLYMTTSLTSWDVQCIRMLHGP